MLYCNLRPKFEYLTEQILGDSRGLTICLNFMIGQFMAYSPSFNQ